MYYVWKRNDGYIAASCNGMAGNFTSANGEKVTFEKLGEFDKWPDAYDCIVTARSSKPCGTSHDAAVLRDVLEGI